jgi:hypothetical protein
VVLADQLCGWLLRRCRCWLPLRRCLAGRLRLGCLRGERPDRQTAHIDVTVADAANGATDHDRRQLQLQAVLQLLMAEVGIGLRQLAEGDDLLRGDLRLAFDGELGGRHVSGWIAYN